MTEPNKARHRGGGFWAMPPLLSYGALRNMVG